MLFNSYEFVFVFLPVALLGYFLLGRLGNRPANAWILVLGFLFYGWWDLRYLPLLLGSIFVNWLISGRIIKAKGGVSHAEGNKANLRLWFWLGVTFNVCLLGYYKYLDFFIANLNWLGAEIPLLHLVLPLGVSFFTITQMIYLLDCYAGVARDHDLLNYALFVSFFPHLLAGPILYYKPIMKQFTDTGRKLPDVANLSRGVTLFVIGLAKKVIIADSFIPFVNQGFAGAAGLTLAEGWLVAICYALQLYFDFSGYSDMAIGVARMLNIEIPANFRAPFRATSLANFWQRWHISLTNAVTACVYMPLVSFFREFTFASMMVAVFISMFITGIWHGAGWNYVIFALMHAGGLVVNQCWKHWRLPMPECLARLLTLVWVSLTFVFFRADDVHQARQILSAMAGFHGACWPFLVDWPQMDFSLALPLLGQISPYILCLALLLVAFCPDSNELAEHRIHFGFSWAAALALIFAYSVLHFSQVTAFLYFQF